MTYCNVNLVRKGGKDREKDREREKKKNKKESKE